MKNILLFMTALTFLKMGALASCLVRLEDKEQTYHVAVWKHTEDQDDTVDHIVVRKDLMQSITPNHTAITFIFNKGVFTAMKYDGGNKKVWATLSNSEKDMIKEVQDKFDVNEK